MHLNKEHAKQSTHSTISDSIAARGRGNEWDSRQVSELDVLWPCRGKCAALHVLAVAHGREGARAELGAEDKILRMRFTLRGCV